MNFELTEEQIAVKEAARDFAQNVLKPNNWQSLDLWE
jgi:hypothetical protein